MVSPQTARNGIVAIDPRATQGDETWDHGLTRSNEDVSRFGVMPPRLPWCRRLVFPGSAGIALGMLLTFVAHYSGKVPKI